MTTTYCFDPEHGRHQERGHPEAPGRLSAVMARLRTTGLLDNMLQVPVTEATLDAVHRVHPEAYVSMLEAACIRGGGRLDVDTYATEASWAVALRAAGGLIGIVDAVMTNKAENGFALVRPPGHHARPFAAMGFCLLANVAIAARHAQAVHGIERVLIVDFDVHHGNGTQEIFYDDPSVLVYSSHQHPCYPGTGMVDEIGAGEGEGFTVNLPYPPGTTDEPLLAAYRRTLLPVVARFRPDLVLVSAGFDGHHLDPLASAALSVTGFANLMGMLRTIADEYCSGRLIATLEGGYHAAALASSVEACITLMMDPAAPIADTLGTMAGGPDLSDIVTSVMQTHNLP